MANWQNILEKAVAPVALMSFGKDSLLMLDMMREVRTDVPVIHFGPVDKFAQGIIRQWNLTVYSWAPAQRSILIDGDETALVSDYDFGGQLLPVVEEVEPGDVCCGSVNDKPTLMHFDYDFDATFIGWKASDEVPMLGGLVNILDGMPFGSTRLYAPLRDLTDADVYAELARRGLPIPEPEPARKFCTKCLRGEVFCPLEKRLIPAHQWSPEASLSAFQARFAA